MIDINSIVITKVQEAVDREYPQCFVSSDYLRSPRSLPAVSVVEQSNWVPVAAATSSTVEGHAVIMYQIDIYSSDEARKKSEARQILNIVDGVFERLGFRRLFCRPTLNANESTIYRFTARYQATVTQDHMIGRH